MVVSWILNTIEPTLRSTITFMEIAKDRWDDIKEWFSVGNGPRIIIANFEQNLVCKCGSCKCNIGAELDKKREEERLHQFLMGLDDSVYGTVCSNILSTEPLPSLNRAYSMIIQEERVRNITRGKEQQSEHMAFAFKIESTSKGRTDNRDTSMVCPNCNKPGHNAESCFKLIGYPDWWGDRPKGSGRGLGRGQGGSKQSTCSGEKGSGGPIRANATIVTSQESKTTETEKGGLSGLSSEQWNILINSLNAPKDVNQGRLNGTFKTMEWIIHTGASHHIAGRFELMSNIRKMLSCPYWITTTNRCFLIYNNGLVKSVVGERVFYQNENGYKKPMSYGLFLGQRQRFYKAVVIERVFKK
ncbi:hypothetical protein F511_30344 [Dorcoceras hygrometricum]|uniref:CCHC-type domain-containing protein n=1 Tax=Dorcoceras hygrometricum TaxID=472368 RepID=A0A2Z7D6A9_9LAMI|nr:hypothetical protein F511_30344 [Dorcoceras hygrometricum]